jgi:hypothetical protein
MPRYFFAIQAFDREVTDDPSGIVLPDVSAALSHAECIISKLRAQSGYDDAGSMMLVKDETQRLILYLPFVVCD